MYNVLLVDDDLDIQFTNKTYLSKQGFEIFCAKTSMECLQILRGNPINCIVLDIMLQNESGYELCKQIKNLTDVPIIFLTNLVEKQEMEQGFICGGDDYMVKPYDLKELELRILARIRQQQKSTSHLRLIQVPPLLINLDSRSIYIYKKQILLTSFEFDILVLLVQNPQRAFTISQIYQLIWRMPDIKNAQTVQVHIAHLRKKLDQAFPQHHFIQTVWGKGYMFCEYSMRKG